MPESAICLFDKDLLQIDWAKTLYQLHPDTLADKLDQILDEKINKFFPIQELTIDTRRNAPWFNAQAQKLRTEQRKEFLKNGKTDRFYSLSKDFRKLVQKAKSDFRKKCIENSTNAGNA